MPEDEHVLETIGRTRVVVRDGRVAEIGAPRLRRCPLARKFAIPVVSMEPDTIRKNVEQRIREFGMCTDGRILLSDQDFVPFGASEQISCGLRQGLLDAAVLVCEGAGTVVVSDPRMVQGIGGRMSGVVRTSPLPGVIEGIRKGGGTVISEQAALDPVAGAAEAYRQGFHRVAVTVADPETATVLRVKYPLALLFGVHCTGLTRAEAEEMVRACDLVSACASRTIREVAGPVALLQAGGTVPVFALTPEGKILVLARLAELTTPLLVKASSLPFVGGEQPEPLV